jgi:hypothetical protein
MYTTDRGGELLRCGSILEVVRFASPGCSFCYFIFCQNASLILIVVRIYIGILTVVRTLSTECPKKLLIRQDPDMGLILAMVQFGKVARTFT